MQELPLFFDQTRYHQMMTKGVHAINTYIVRRKMLNQRDKDKIVTSQWQAIAVAMELAISAAKVEVWRNSVKYLPQAKKTVIEHVMIAQFDLVKGLQQ